jgi:hypothetical protein
MVSPTLSFSLTKLEKRPSATRLTPTRKVASPGAEQIE